MREYVDGYVERPGEHGPERLPENGPCEGEDGGEHDEAMGEVVERAYIAGDRRELGPAESAAFEEIRDREYAEREEVWRYAEKGAPPESSLILPSERDSAPKPVRDDVHDRQHSTTKAPPCTLFVAIRLGAIIMS